MSFMSKLKKIATSKTGSATTTVKTTSAGVSTTAVKAIVDSAQLPINGVNMNTMSTGMGNSHTTTMNGVTSINSNGRTISIGTIGSVGGAGLSGSVYTNGSANQGPMGAMGPVGRPGRDGFPTEAEWIRLNNTIDEISSQVCLLRPLLEKHEKFPALKEAYDQYMIILKLIGDEGDESAE